MELGLKGKQALITGGSRGIGLGVAELLAAEGCHLHLAARSADDLEAARAGILRKHAVEITCHAADLSNAANAVALARDCGNVDFLVNNAGAIPQGTLDTLDDATWKQAWDLKVFGFIDITREIYARMRERRSGVIVNVIGAAGERPVASYIAGSMGNAALMAFTRALGAESPEFNVRVVGVNPGGTATDRAVKRLRERATKDLGNADRWPELVSKSPFGRMATVEEIGALVAFLCSPLSGYTTGTIITVDGGASSRRA
ncbi:MAG: SDR family oxidoreductase [Betaproteobacteria bacterium]|nr:MAG: SDR family oxidoreductase [Betaproteobacteria bacterium]